MTDMWNRFVSVQIGNLYITSDQLDIEFSVKGSNSSDANSVEVSIWNLAKKTRDAIKQDQDILLRAGYVSDVGDLFAGKVKYVSEERDQGDLKTKITCLTKGYATGLAPVKYPVGTPLQTIIAAAFTKSGITPQKIDDQGFTLEQDYTSETTAAADLDYCAKIINGSSRVHKPARYYIEANSGYFVTQDFITSEVVILSSETGLIETLPETPDDGSYSRSIRCAMTHRIKVDSLIDLQSLDSRASGTYKVVEYTHKYEGTEYETECKVKPS